MARWIDLPIDEVRARGVREVLAEETRGLASAARDLRFAPDNPIREHDEAWARVTEACQLAHVNVAFPKRERERERSSRTASRSCACAIVSARC